MKAKFESSFEYGRRISKYLALCAIFSCLAGIFAADEGSMQQLIFVLISCALFAATVIVMYRHCRCPYCGKHIMIGVLTVKTCPACHRNLVTGKKTKKNR